MTLALVRKILRDVRIPLLVVALLLAAFQCLWVKITQRVTAQLLPLFLGLANAQKISPDQVEKILFEGPGKIMRTLMGGENIALNRAMDMLSVGYVHPTMQTLFCIWAIGRAAGAIVGEIDRGTMELLLAQPLPRSRVILANFLVDLVVIPALCLSMWSGTWLGKGLVGPIEVSAKELEVLPFKVTVDPETLQIDAAAFGPALWNVGALLFAISGYTIWLSARGRFRNKTLGVAVLVTLLQFLINVLGQLWEPVAMLRPFTVFFYFQPQTIVLRHQWSVDLGTAWNDGQPLFAVNVLMVLFLIGAVGYLMAWRTFTRRDLPAPL
jgi:ABC-2 type transport system permease protein